MIEWIVVPAVITLIAIGFASIILRYAFDGEYAIFWSEELLKYGFIWIFWLVAPILISQGALFGVDLITAQLPEFMRRLLALLCQCGNILLLSVYTYQGTRMAILNWRQLSTALEVPLGLAYAAIPVGSAGMLVIVLWQTLGLLKGRPLPTGHEARP
jgi:TRAP-type C4-dicarboxylate transport system permease small subunit